MNSRIQNIRHDVSLFTEQDIYLFRQGTHYRLYEKLGSHFVEKDGVRGVYFAVWAPAAESVSVVGEFNGWNRQAHPLGPRWDQSGIWEGFIPGVEAGTLYKYFIVSKHENYQVEKRDPFAFYCEIPPKTASIVRDLNYSWSDGVWMDGRAERNSLESPMSVYEMHLGSWQRPGDDPNRFLQYGEVADRLTSYIHDMNFTHVEFLPVMAHPFYGSWGYQTIGYFAPTSRYGTPQDLMGLIDRLHQSGVGVIFDWVPSHFPSDEHGLAFFDGTHLFEHADARQGYHPDWKSYIFNYGRNETRSFLISSAMFWMDKYHADGLRVDAVASMLYLDYSRKEGEWIPNKHGGRENLEAIAFLRQLNEEIYKSYPDAQIIAEESTAWPSVSRPVYLGGLGFGMKWNMGWMHDTLEYMQKDPIYRKYHHNELTFSMVYAFTENFMLPLSHDEVVHGKSSLFNKMPGDEWQKFANLRLLYGFMYSHPGKKLLFMGGEFGQQNEWNHDQSLDWHLLDHLPNQGLHRWMKELNYFYKTEPALHGREFNSDGFEWLVNHDSDRSILGYMRRGKSPDEDVLIVCNFTPSPHANYKVGVSKAGFWKEVLNSDAKEYGGSGQGNLGGVEASPVPFRGKNYSLSLTVPPLAVLFFKRTQPEK